MPESPDDLVVLTSASSEMQAALWVSVLASHGIDAVGPASAATVLRWEVAGTDPFKLYVRRRDVERAREALARDRADSVDIDWSEVDTGEPEPEGEADDKGGRGMVIGIVCGVIALMMLLSLFWSLAPG